MSNKLQLKFSKENFGEFVSRLGDLTSIEDTVKIKIDRDRMLIYSLVGNESGVLSLKTYIYKTSYFIEKFDKDEIYDIILVGAAKFVKNLKFFSSEEPLKFEITFKPLPNDPNTMHVRSINISNKKLKVTAIGGEEHKIRDININSIESKLDPKKSKWSFKILRDDFLDIKKLASINSEDKILNINLIDGSVTICESSKWELKVDENISWKNCNLVFGKKYLGNINTDSEYINFYIFDTYILVKDTLSNLMLSFEQNFDEDDDE